MKSKCSITGMDDSILSLKVKGMSTRIIAGAFQDIYGADILASLVSLVTKFVIEKVVEWQYRPLDGIYPIVYFDRIVLKICQNKK